MRTAPGPPCSRRRNSSIFSSSPGARSAIPAPFGTDLADCREESRVVVGVREAFGAVYDLLGWDRLFGARRASANRIVKELVLARIARPLSKRATVRELDAHGELALDLDYVYRSMDMLDDGRIKAIRAAGRWRSRRPCCRSL